VAADNRTGLSRQFLQNSSKNDRWHALQTAAIRSLPCATAPGRRVLPAPLRLRRDHMPHTRPRLDHPRAVLCIGAPPCPGIQPHPPRGTQDRLPLRRSAHSCLIGASRSSWSTPSRKQGCLRCMPWRPDVTRSMIRPCASSIGHPAPLQHRTGCRGVHRRDRVHLTTCAPHTRVETRETRKAPGRSHRPPTPIGTACTRRPEAYTPLRHGCTPRVLMLQFLGEVPHDPGALRRRLVRPPVCGHGARRAGPGPRPRGRTRHNDASPPRPSWRDACVHSRAVCRAAPRFTAGGWSGWAGSSAP